MGPVTTAGLFVSPPPAAFIPLPTGCTWYLDTAPLFVLGSFAGAFPTAWVLTFTVPADPSLVGQAVHIQGASLVSGGPLGGLELTNGLELTIVQ